MKMLRAGLLATALALLPSAALAQGAVGPLGLPGTGDAGYPAGAIPQIAEGTGTTAGATATLAGVPSQFTYLCGLSVISGTASTAININVTSSGLPIQLVWVLGAPLTAVGTTGELLTVSFSPCLRSTAVNTNVVIAAGSLGAGGNNQTVNIWGFTR